MLNTGRVIKFWLNFRSITFILNESQGRRLDNFAPVTLHMFIQFDVYHIAALNNKKARQIGTERDFLRAGGNLVIYHQP